MSQFNFQEYQDVVAKTAQNNGVKGSVVKVGFFKLKNDNDEALVRFNIKSTDDLNFATIHQFGASQKYMKVNCLAPFGAASNAAVCPLCRAAEAGDPNIGKAAKRVFVQAMVAYKDPATGGFSTAIPVIWERPAGFAREIADLLRNYGDLTEHVFKYTRSGIAGARDTRYTPAYLPIFDKEELVPKDFSAFNNFDISKHSYWVKTVAEIEEFLETGKFPAITKASGKSAAQAAAATTNWNPVAQTAPVASTVSSVSASAPILEVNTAAEPVKEAAVTEAPWVNPVPVGGVTPSTAPAEEPAPAISTDRPARKFGGFTF